MADNIRNAILSMSEQAGEMGVVLNWGSLSIESELVQYSRNLVDGDKPLTTLVMLTVEGERE